MRLLGLAFGVTIFAISTVLAAFMAGLAIGSILGGRRADTVARPLRVYGLGRAGRRPDRAAHPVGLRVGCKTSTPAWRRWSIPARRPVAARRAILAFVVLLVPTALMGATLPLAVRGARRRVEPTRPAATRCAMGLLYAANTTGAIVGCLLSGFVLIGHLGLTETIAVAAACNLRRRALAALVLSRRVFLRVPHAAPKRPRSRTARGTPLARAAFWVFALSGAISLAYEVVWSRILAVLFDSSIYGFVLMLATVLFGIAVGGALGGLFVGRWPRAQTGRPPSGGCRDRHRPGRGPGPGQPSAAPTTS